MKLQVEAMGIVGYLSFLGLVFSTDEGHVSN